MNTPTITTPKSRSYRGMTKLHDVMLMGSHEDIDAQLQDLVEHTHPKDLVNARNQENETPLMILLRLHRFTATTKQGIITRMLPYLSNLKIQYACHLRTVVHLAMEFGSVFDIEAVLDQLHKIPNAREVLNTRDQHGCSALMNFFFNERNELKPQERSNIIRQLLKVGSDVSIPSSHGNTALHFALGRGQVCDIRAILDHLETLPEDPYRTNLVNTQNTQGRTPLLQLFTNTRAHFDQEETLEIMTRLVDLGLGPVIVVVPTTNPEPQEAAAAAAAGMVHFPDMTNLQQVMEFGSIHDIQSILGHSGPQRALVNVQDQHECTALMNFFFNTQVSEPQERVGILHQLLQAGSDVSMETKNQNTALHFALQRGQVGDIFVMLEHLASRKWTSTAREALLGVENHEGRTPLVSFFYNAQEFTRPQKREILRRLVQFGSPGSVQNSEPEEDMLTPTTKTLSSIHEPLESGTAEDIQFVIHQLKALPLDTRQVILNERDKDGCSALMNFFFNDRRPVAPDPANGTTLLGQILELGVVDFGLTLANGNTTLHFALERGRFGEIQALLNNLETTVKPASRKKLLNVQNNYGYTPLMAFCIHCRDTFTKSEKQTVITRVVQWGADLTIQSSTSHGYLNAVEMGLMNDDEDAVLAMLDWMTQHVTPRILALLTSLLHNENFDRRYTDAQLAIFRTLARSSNDPAKTKGMTTAVPVC